MKTFKQNLGGIVMSLVELIVGILLLVNPAAFTSGIIIACGIVLMVMGIISIVKYFRAEPAEAKAGQSLAKGLIGLLAGAFCALKSQWFVATFPVLTLIYGVVILLSGLTKIQWMADLIRMKRKSWFLAAISAVISILCGVIVITIPFTTTAVLWIFTGISLIVEAVFDMIGTILGNRKKKTEEAKAEN